MPDPSGSRRGFTDSHFNCSGYARGIAQVLELKESELNALLNNTHLPPDVLYAGSSVHMDVDQFLQVINNAQDLVDDPEVGLRCGKYLQRSVHGPVGLLNANAPDLFTALSTPAEFRPLLLPLAQTSVSFDDQWLVCKMQVPVSLPEHTRRIIIEAFALTVQANVEAYPNDRVQDGYFSFDFPPPHYFASYNNYFTLPTYFNAEATSLHLPAECAGQRRVGQDPLAYQAAFQLCTQMLADLPDDSLDIVDRVRRLLLSNDIGVMTEEDVARALFISKRTLARRLASRGQSYRRIREALLAELSARYLAEDRIKVEATARLLGYHDAANFRRAFKRWHHMTPADFRLKVGVGNRVPANRREF